MKIDYEFMEKKAFFEFFNQHRYNIFEADFDFRIENILSDEEKEKRKENWQQYIKPKSYQLVAKTGDKIVGWSFGMQQSPEDFYMVNSAVFPEYRQQGIYTEMMQKGVEKATEMGFQRIFSRHKMSNNAILIPKLKFGFAITGFEVVPRFGTMVVLSYYPNKRRRELLDIRIGSRKPDEEDMKLIM